MKKYTTKALASLALLLAAVAAAPPAAADPVKVELRQSPDGKWQLVRGGEPFLIKGAGGDYSKQALRDLGGNSFRTWGVGDDTQAKLDEARRLGLAVTLGIWLGHERHGFDYNNADRVAQQYEQARQAVLQFKDHPAVLMWAVGNEMDGVANGDNAAVWGAVNNIASMIKKLDPHHPTMTVITEIGGDRVKNVHRLCPDVDVVGINSYAGMQSVGERYRKLGGTKPFVVTEFGPPGTWETQANAFGAMPELTTTQKAQWYRDGYAKTILGEPKLALGCYAFAWGNKQEATATWYGMFLPDGSRLAAVDAMAELWGKPVANKVPTIEPLTVDGPDQVEPGGAVRVALKAADPEGDPLAVTWELHQEAAKYSTGGDHEAALPQFPAAIVSASQSGAELKMPAAPGGYRLFAIVRDGKGGAAVANVPLLVKGNAATPKPVASAAAAPKAAGLPLVVYGDAVGDRPPFIPSGYMGNHAAIAMDEKSTTSPHAGRTCLKIEYRAADGFGGVVWQDPPNDWGDAPGGRDLSGATKLTFWARGEAGGEKVEFKFGVIGKDKPYHDTATGATTVTLGRAWKQYVIDVPSGDLSRIKSGFVWVLAGQGKPLTFYVDDVQFE